MRVSAIVPAAGSGSRIQKRLGMSLPKPYLEIGGVPILARTLSNLQAVPDISEIIVACDTKYRTLVKNFAGRFGLAKLKKIIPGGKTRTDSVYRALRRVDRKSRGVLIHDGVRPFLPPDAIGRLVRAFNRQKAGGWVAGRPVTPTIKELGNGRVRRTLERRNLWEIETPQIFEKKTLLQAYRNYHRVPFEATDDASLVERLGKPVRVFPIDAYNMKITTPTDLALARKLLDRPETRVGTGEDRHRLEAGRPLYLGGVKVASPWGARGHSDGDVILHSLVDAILGALGLGDIGDYFPDSRREFSGARSALFLKKALSLMRESGFELLNLDVTVTLEKPKLGPAKDLIKKSLARLTGLGPRSIGVKAKTAEGLGPEGRCEAIAARAAVNLRRLI